MEAPELRDKSTEELTAQVTALKESIFRLRFKVRLGEAGSLNHYRTARRDLARVKTVLRERELNQ